jgi:biotin transporter BioY
MMQNIARYLIIFGLVMMVVGGIFYLAAKLGFKLSDIPLGRLPGDFRIQVGNLTCLIPIVSSIILSVILTALINLVHRLLNH